MPWLQLQVILYKSLQDLHIWVWTVYLSLPDISSQALGSVCDLPSARLSTDVPLVSVCCFGFIQVLSREAPPQFDAAVAMLQYKDATRQET